MVVLPAGGSPYHTPNEPTQNAYKRRFNAQRGDERNQLFAGYDSFVLAGPADFLNLFLKKKAPVKRGLL